MYIWEHCVSVGNVYLTVVLIFLFNIFYQIAKINYSISHLVCGIEWSLRGYAFESVVSVILCIKLPVDNMDSPA